MIKDDRVVKALDKLETAVAELYGEPSAYLDLVHSILDDIYLRNQKRRAKKLKKSLEGET